MDHNDNVQIAIKCILIITLFSILIKFFNFKSKHFAVALWCNAYSRINVIFAHNVETPNCYQFLFDYIFSLKFFLFLGLICQTKKRNKKERKNSDTQPTIYFVNADKAIYLSFVSLQKKNLLLLTPVLLQIHHSYRHFIIIRKEHFEHGL